MTLCYHGTPITPVRVLIEEMAGACFCVSYAAPAQVRLCHEIGQSVMLDFPAYSVWKSGHVADLAGYYGWVDPWLDYPLTIATIPDVINGGEEVQDELIRQWPHGERGRPVYHMDEPIERCLRLLDEWPWIAIGSSGQYAEILSPAWERRMDAIWREIDGRHRRTPDVHMMRGMQLTTRRWPFARVDSTDIARNHNRAQNTAFKMRVRWDAAQCPPRFICRGEQKELAA